MNNTSISDSDFIEGSISENYPVPLLSEEEYLKIPADMRNDMQEHLIEITRNDIGESRTFRVNQYAELLLEGFLHSVDNTKNYNNKLLILANAKYKLNHLSDFLYSFDKYEFKREFKKIDDTIEYLKNHKELGTFDEISPILNETSDCIVTKSDRLKDKLITYHFFELQLVKNLKNSSNLLTKLNKNKLPYRIAMFHFLGFITYLEHEHFDTKDDMYKEIASWFDSTAREISGNIRVLNPKSNEDRVRYTADQCLEKVEQDYNRIK